MLLSNEDVAVLQTNLEGAQREKEAAEAKKTGI